MPWVDEKRRYDSDEVKGSEIKLGILRLSVHRHIHHAPDVWLASCHGLFSQVVLASKDLDEAKCQAKAKVQAILEDAIKAILEA